MLDRYQAVDPEKLGLKAGARVLDVGCGTGRHLLELSHFPVTLVGLDMSREDLRKTWYIYLLTGQESQEGRLPSKLELIVGGGERLPFPDGAFDRVLCTETLEHVPDDSAVLRELLRVLKPEGILVISVPDEYSERLLWRFSDRYYTTPGGHVRIYKRNQIRRLLRENGAVPFAVEYKQSLESVRWLAHSVIDKEWGKPGRVTKALRWLLDTPSHRNWRVLAWCDAVGNRFLPKSVVLYGRKVGPAAQ
jgi:ubiquinone/menaquinone biosynthesis C-methylase UbiE